MSGTFTIPLKRVIELTGGQTSFVDGNTVVTGGNIGLSHYPIFEETYRVRLTGLIVDHYWNQEIGVESVDMFQLAMRRKMNEIMPRYNKMYQSERLTLDPLKTVDIHVLYTGNSVQVVENENDNTQGVVAAGTTEVDSENESSGNKGSTNHTDNSQDTTSVAESSNESDSSSKSRVVASETPQSFLSGNGDYATSANDVNGTTNNGATGSENSSQNVTGDTDSVGTETSSDRGTGKTTGTTNDTSNTTANGTSKTDATQNRNDDTHTSGYQGVASDLIMRYRESLINIDLMVIADLAECFMQIWNNGDEYSNANTNRNRYY